MTDLRDSCITWFSDYGNHGFETLRQGFAESTDQKLAQDFIDVWISDPDIETGPATIEQVTTVFAGLRASFPGWLDEED